MVASRRIRNARLRRGHSQLALAEAAGVSLAVVESLEGDVRLGGSGCTDLQGLTAVCGVLGISLLSALGAGASVPDEEVRSLHYVVRQLGGSAYREDLERVLDWDSERLDRVTIDLVSRMEAVGLRCIAQGELVALREPWNPLDSDATERLALARSGRNDLSPSEARLLLDVFDEALPSDFASTASREEAHAIQRLISASLIVETPQGYRVVESVADGLKGRGVERYSDSE
jgi:transcriptional regulator with XRE-family HTH domain